MGENRYVLELKILRRNDTREKAVEQISGYLDQLGLNEGWLVMFNPNPELNWDQKITWDDLDYNGRIIHVVGC